MANTYRKVYLQVVFAVKNRRALLQKPWRADLFKYIAGILNSRGHYSLAVNGVEDHIHIFFDYNHQELIKDLVREIKKASNKFINDRNLCPHKFEWQTGYAIFSYSNGQKNTIINYILNQEEHHRENTFQQEYMEYLTSFDIDFNKDFVFEFIKEK